MVPSPRGMSMWSIVVFLSLSGLPKRNGGQYDVAHGLPAQLYSDRMGISRFRSTQSSPEINGINPTIPGDYDLKRFLLSKLRQSYMILSEKPLPGLKSQMHKRQTNEKELIKQLLIILQRLQNQRVENPILTMSSLRFR